MSGHEEAGQMFIGGGSGSPELAAAAAVLTAAFVRPGGPDLTDTLITGGLT